MASRKQAQTASKPKTRTGITRAVLLRPEHDERLNELVEATGLNRNKIIRRLAMGATPEQILAWPATADERP